MTTDDRALAPAPEDVTARRENLPTDKPLVTYGGRNEDNPLHRPDPYFQYGNLDTSGGTLPSEQMDTISPAFAEARAANLVTAARALDPADPTPRELVVTPEGAVTVQGTTKTLAEAHEDIYGALERQYEEPVVLGGGDPRAAEGIDPDDTDESDNPELTGLDYPERREVAEGIVPRRESPVVTEADVARQEAAEGSSSSPDTGTSPTPSSGDSGSSSASTGSSGSGSTSGSSGSGSSSSSSGSGTKSTSSGTKSSGSSSTTKK